MSIADEIAYRIEGMIPGTVFVPSDLFDIASIDNANTVLSRMAKSGEILRVMRGIYAKPLYSELLGRYVLPSPEEVAYAIARSNKWTISPSGDTALNRLGLDTQVPAMYEYVSSGPYKQYGYGKFTITMKHRANRDLIECSPLTCLIIQALKALGKDSADRTLAERLAERLSPEEISEFYEETRNATAWVFSFAKLLREVKDAQIPEAT